jgi:hypothetical protein
VFSAATVLHPARKGRFETSGKIAGRTEADLLPIAFAGQPANG